MKTPWEKYILVFARRDQHESAALRVRFNATGTELVLVIDGKALTLATKWQGYVTDCGAQQLIDAINEGMKALKEGHRA